MKVALNTYNNYQNSNKQSFKGIKINDAELLGEKVTYQLYKAFKPLKKTHNVNITPVAYPYTNIAPDLKIGITRIEKGILNKIKAFWNKKRAILETPNQLKSAQDFQILDEKAAEIISQVR